MSNEEKYIGVFTKLFEINREEAIKLKYQDIDAWDSVGHMTLITEIEEVFNIEMDADDIIDFESFEAGKRILSTHYNIEF